LPTELNAAIGAEMSKVEPTSFVTFAGQLTTAARRVTIVAGSAARAAENKTAGPNFDPVTEADRQAELVALRGGRRLWTLDGGRSTIVSVSDKETKRVGFHKIDLTTGKSSALLEENKAYIYPPAYGRAVYEDEGRWQGVWSYANQVDFVNRMIAWFGERLMEPRQASQ
jgi:hypothetical protein